MNDTFVIDTLAEYFKEEILNKVEKQDGGLIIKLANGTTAKIKVISLA